MHIQQLVQLVDVLGFLTAYLLDRSRQLLDFFRIEVAHDLRGKVFAKQDHERCSRVLPRL